MKKSLSVMDVNFFTKDQNLQRVDDSKSNLTIFQSNSNEFFRGFVTLDETWIHYYTPGGGESIKQSVTCVAGTGRKPPKATQE